MKIYAMTHKKFEQPKDSLYVPLQVGAAVHDDLGYLRDDGGENISALNCYYSELTGFYYLWKNVHDLDYIGTCHYRRYLLNAQGYIFTEGELRELLQDYDLITTKRVLLNNSYHFGFAANHNIKALDMTGEVIRELYPAYYDTFLALVNGPETYFGNIFVTSKEKFDSYCDWFFSIFQVVAQRIDLDTDKDAYHRRVFGFISEFLLYVWTTVNQLKVYECKVGMLGEKAETREVRECLAAYLRAGKIEEAKAYFMEVHAKRPDILMEASDITGELHMAMQIIATVDMEQKTKGHSYLEKECELTRLIPLFTELNRVITDYSLGKETEADKAFLQETNLPQEAIMVGVAILPNPKLDKDGLRRKMFADYAIGRRK